MDERGSIFSYMSTDRYVQHLREHRIEPTDEEKAGLVHEMEPGKEVSLLHTDQRSGSANEGSAK